MKLQTQEHAVQNILKVKKFVSDNPTICSPDVHAALDNLNLELYEGLGCFPSFSSNIILIKINYLVKK